MGLNFTSTKPSLRFVSFLKQTGYVATPDCFRTFGLLGAVSSFSIVHFASPLPVLVAVQPAGAWPTVPASKLTESAAATAASTTATARVMMVSGLIDGSLLFPSSVAARSSCDARPGNQPRAAPRQRTQSACAG